MPNNPLITILMPCYNAQEYLPEALESIMQQSYQNLEILCINDGSTDDTGKILEGYAKEDKRIRVVHNETNLKLIKTLNKGIDLAKGEYIVRMDADDISELNRIKIIYNALLTSAADVLSTGYTYIDTLGVKQSTFIPFCTQDVSIEYSTYFITPLNHAGSIFKKDVLKEIKYDNAVECLHVEDYCLWTSLIQNKKKLVNVKAPLYLIRKNPNSVSHKFEEMQKRNFINALQNYHVSMGYECTHMVAQVLALRQNKDTNVSALYAAIKHQKKITKQYHAKHKENKAACVEIKDLRNYIFLSVLLQTIKRGKLSLKLTGLLLLITRPVLKLKTWRRILSR